MIFILPLLGGVSYGQQAKPSPRSTPEIREMRLTKIESISGALSTKHYFYLKEEGFRIQMPGNFAEYVPSKAASAEVPGTDGYVRWTLPESEMVIMFGEADPKIFAPLTPEKKLQILSIALNGTATKNNNIKISERDVTFNGLSAKEVKFKEGNEECIARGLFLDSRLFVFLAILQKVDNADAVVKQALDTFEPVKD